MTESLNTRLATSDGRRAFDREIAQFLRSERYREAEALLEAELDRRPGTIAERCRAISLDAVRLSGWEQLDAAVPQLGDQVTALGLNLSNYNDSVAGAEWYDKEPAIEVAYYADDAHPFSAASRDELLAACAEPPSPWQGRMLPVGGPPPLTVRGLRLLNREILLYGNDSPWRPRSSGDLPPAPDEHIAFVLGQWFLHLRFHQAVARDLTARGLGRTMPVIIGEHDVGSYVRAIVIAHAHGNPTVNPIAAAPATARTDSRDIELQAEDFIQSMRRSREAIRSCSWFEVRKRRSLVAEAAARDEAFLSKIGLAWPHPSWEGNDAGFEALTRAVRICVSSNCVSPGTAPTLPSRDASHRR